MYFHMYQNAPYQFLQQSKKLYKFHVTFSKRRFFGNADFSINNELRYIMGLQFAIQFVIKLGKINVCRKARSLNVI